jgi:hypothetical protein
VKVLVIESPGCTIQQISTVLNDYMSILHTCNCRGFIVRTWLWH